MRYASAKVTTQPLIRGSYYDALQLRAMRVTEPYDALESLRLTCSRGCKVLNLRKSLIVCCRQGKQVGRQAWTPHRRGRSDWLISHCWHQDFEWCAAGLTFDSLSHSTTTGPRRRSYYQPKTCPLATSMLRPSPQVWAAAVGTDTHAASSTGRLIVPCIAGNGIGYTYAASGLQ